jgi:hypothetical protein
VASPSTFPLCHFDEKTATDNNDLECNALPGSQSWYDHFVFILIIDAQIIMNIYPKTDKILPNALVWKMLGCFVVLYLPTVLAMKFIAPLIYGAIATQEAIYHTITAMIMPPMMIGMGLLSLRAETASLKNLLIRSFVMFILISGLALWAGLPIFMSR